MGTEPSENLKMRFSTSRKYIKLPFRQHSWIQAPSLCRCLSHPTCALCLAQGRQGRCCRCGRGGWHACAQDDQCAWSRKRYPGGRSSRS